jgi:hypothetical protein
VELVARERENYMEFLKRKLGRWTVPTVLTAVVVAAVAIAPAFGGSKSVTTKKVKKITTNKINANNALTHTTELRVAGVKDAGTTIDLNARNALIATHSALPAGNYVVSTTFTLTRDSAGLVVNCELRAGGHTDSSNSFGGGGQLQDNVSMSVTTALTGNVELRCADGSPASDSHIRNIEITSLRVPDVTLQNG